jgi:hypothetical protein
MNNSLLGDADCKAKLRHNWEHWTRQKRHYPEKKMWWSRQVKKKLRQFYILEGGETSGKWKTSIMNVSTTSYEVIAHMKRN